MASTPPSKASLSVVLITHNAAEQLARTLDAVSWADEILVVDSGSTDGTVEIAKRLGAKVVVQPDWQGFGYQKNFALARARGDWMLVLDADEVVDVAVPKVGSVNIYGKNFGEDKKPVAKTCGPVGSLE